MEIPPATQDPYFPTDIPDGFAFVPIQLFVLMAKQLPAFPSSFTAATLGRPQGNDSLYERAMTYSLN